MVISWLQLLVRLFLSAVPGSPHAFHILSWRTSKVLFIIFLFMIALHVFSHQRFEFTGSLLLAKSWRSVYKQNLCLHVTKEMRNGKWRLRRDLKPEDDLHRREQDVRIRKLRGLPTKLHREDTRCGNLFVIDAPGFGPSIPALCDPRSVAPCCNQKFGQCGSGKEYCLCNRCKDFRNTVMAELNEFVSTSGCEFKNFTSKQACELLSERVSSFTLIGDSLVRHFHNALMILFTDDKETGCLNKDINETHKELCSGDMQFVDGGKATCHGKTAKNIYDLPDGKFCQGKHSFLYSFQEFYSLAHTKLALNQVQANLHKKNSVVAIGVGLHMDLNADKVLKDYLKPILQLKEQAESQWPLIVWLTTHAHGSIKPIAYLQTQGNDRISRFNTDMRAFLEPIGVPVFDTFNLTLGVHSYDGTHYGFGVNMIKAQLFMNFLEETFQEQ